MPVVPIYDTPPVVPVARTGHLIMSFGGFTMGWGTPYDILSVSGLDGYDADAGYSPGPGMWGGVPTGQNLREKPITLSIGCAPSMDLIDAFEDAFLPCEQYGPLVPRELQWSSKMTLPSMSLAYCDRRMRPRVPRTGARVEWVVLLVAPDPRVYDASPTTVVASPSFVGTEGFFLDIGSGVTWGYDLDVGTGTGSGHDFEGTPGAGPVILRNTGNVATFPTVEFVAPRGMSRWAVINDTTGGSAAFSFPLGAGQRMVVSFAAAATPDTGDPVTVEGAPRPGAWERPRTPLAIIPGDNAVRFLVLDGVATGAQALFTFRSARQ